MFSSKKITKAVASVLITLMFMALIPLTGGSSVRADGLDKDKAETLAIHSERNIDPKISTTTYLFHAPYTMKYRFELDISYDDKVLGHKPNATITLYDSSEKQIASSANMLLTAELSGNKDYYIVVETDSCYYLFSCEYDYYIDISIKKKNSNSFESVNYYSHWGSSVYDDNMWCQIEVNDSTNVKADLNIGSVPNGMKLNYEWSWDKTGNNKFESIGSSNSSLSIKNAAGTHEVYKCSIKSSDGKFSDYILFQVNTTDTFTFLDGNEWAYDAKAFKPGEERKIKFPDTYYSGNPNSKPNYYFEEYKIYEYKYGSGDGQDFTIPSTWKIPATFCSAYNNNAVTHYLGLFFVFADGAGKKVTSGNSYSLEDGNLNDGFEQAIFSFTPEKTGTYRFNSSDVTSGYSVCAIFDQDRNLVATSLGDYIKEDIKTFDIKADLTGGKTYYIAIPTLFLVDVKCKLNISEVEKSSVTSGTFEDFVERLYVVALERPSEPEGKAFWCEKVQDGTYDGAYCARFFLTSPEFLGKNKTDEQFVDTLYRTFFDREADDEGRAFWIKKIKESSKETVIEGFINSTEWCNICAAYGVKSGAQWAKATIASKNATDFATRLYTECLGREAEEGGLKYWSLSLTNLERTGTQAAKEFFYSEEFLSKNLSNEEYIMRLYGTFMGRTPEADGKAYWLDLLNKGGSRDEVFNFFAS